MLGSQAVDAAFWPSLERLDWVMALPNAAAPGFTCLAGLCAGQPVGGGGTFLEAVAKLAGEAAEVLAQSVPPRPSRLSVDPEIAALWTNSTSPTAAAATRLGSGAPTAIPIAAFHADPRLVADRAPQAPSASLGLAAGRNAAEARLAGLLELIERDAASRWWLDGAQPHALDASPLAQAAETAARMRAGATGLPRATTFLDLASPTGVPVVCALSCEADGRGFAFGFKAAIDWARAARGALMELLQMELALELARHRDARGQEAPGDSGPLARARADFADLPAFAARPAWPAPPLPASDLDGLVAHLARLGHRVTACDLEPLPGGLTVTKVFAPGLRPLPGGTATAQPGAPGTRAVLM